VAIVIYPQSWLHNANVYGFLKVINEKSKEGKISFGVMDILKDDGTVILLDEMLDEMYENDNLEGVTFPRLFVFMMEEIVKREGSIEKAYNYFKGNIGYYENYIANVSLTNKEIDELLPLVSNEQQREILLQVKEKKIKIPQIKKKSKELLSKFDDRDLEELRNFLLQSEKEKFRVYLSEIIRSIFRKPDLSGSERCFLCGNPLRLSENTSIRQRKQFSRILFKEFSSSEGEFPNSFWNINNEYHLCDLCSQFALFRHFVFPKNSKKEIFVNVPSFKAIWYLNEAIKAYKDLNIELSVSRAVAEVHMKLQRLLGVWERQNIEIVNYDGKSYSVYYVPQRTVDLLLNTRISSILNSINSIKIFETVIYPERLNKLIEVEYFLLKYFLNPGDDSKIKEYIEVFDPKKKRYYAWMIPELFQEVRNTLGVETVVPVWKMRELGREVSQLFERTRYRLLELIRLAKKDEVYHLLLKTYMANKKPFPEELNRVFSENDENFKNLMFAYVSGIISGGEENE